MSSSENSLNAPLSHKTSLLGLKLWFVVGIVVGISIFSVLALLVLCVFLKRRKKLRKASSTLPITQIPHVSKEINVVGVEDVKDDYYATLDYQSSDEKIVKKEANKVLTMYTKSNNQRSKDMSYQSGEDSESMFMHRTSASNHISTPSPFTGFPELSRLGWGHWFTLRDLQVATDYFSRDRIIGEGGYGIVYYGLLTNGTPVAIKKLLNNLGQAEKEFRVEVDAIGHVRHKHLVRLLGYCVEGTERMLVYEYVNNGNLDQWLHGNIKSHGSLTWESRMKVLVGTSKALAYLHEAIEPKVVHRDIKSSNILIDDEFNAKVSDFGLAKLLGTGKSHITTRVMGTFGYVAPEYASTGLLNEKSDVYSFGVLLLEAITGRDPVDYGRAAHEVNLVDWLKIMISSRRSEEVLDSKVDVCPSTKSLKRALLTVLRCLDPDSAKRPKMSQVVSMLESEVFQTPHQDGRNQRDQSGFSEKPNSEKSEDLDSGLYSSKKRPPNLRK